MRWSVARLIFLREMRDQLRDRRTIFMIVVLPIVLYPALGIVVMQLALGFTDRPSVIGVAGMEYLPELRPNSHGFGPVSALAWLTLTPGSSGLTPSAGSTAIGPMARLIPQRPTMWRAILVSC